MVLTNYKYREGYSDAKILQDAKKNLKSAVSAGRHQQKFCELISDIIEREEIGFFFRPSENDTDNKRPYKYPSKLESVEYIISIIEKTKFLVRSKNDDIFRYHLQSSAQKIVESVCSNIVSSLEKFAANIIERSIRTYERQRIFKFFIEKN